MNAIRKFFLKAITYINAKYVSKYIDNKYWKLIDVPESGKITTLHKEIKLDKIQQYYHDEEIEMKKLNKPAEYTFLLHIFSTYQYRIDDCIIDPDYNWVILDNTHIFKYSYPLIEDPWDSIKRRPSLFKFLARKTQTIEKAILIKYAWTNYYHFWVDTLAQVFLFDKAGIPLDIPIIVPYYFKEIKFVQDFLKIMPLKRKIIIQEKNQYFNVKKLFVGKDVFFSDTIKELKQLILEQHFPETEIGTDSPELIFITRKTKYIRSVKNIVELEEVAKQNNFLIIEPGDYPLTQQMILFSNAKIVIGVHGAGLTNILFCKNASLKVLELLPGGGLTPEHYKFLCKTLDYNYSSIIGDGLDKDKRFSIDRNVFAEAVHGLLK